MVETEALSRSKVVVFFWLRDAQVVWLAELFGGLSLRNANTVLCITHHPLILHSCIITIRTIRSIGTIERIGESNST